VNAMYAMSRGRMSNDSVPGGGAEKDYN